MTRRTRPIACWRPARRLRRASADLIIDPSVIEGDVRGLRPLFVLAATDGTSATIERVRTALEVAMPTGGPATGAEVVAALTTIVDELGRVVMLGVVMTMAVAGASVALAVVGGLLDRRRPFALLRQSGVELRQLRWSSCWRPAHRWSRGDSECGTGRPREPAAPRGSQGSSTPPRVRKSRSPTVAGGCS